MKLTFYEGSKICDERDQQLHFEIETETFGISLKFGDWYWDFWQVVSKPETNLETTLVSVSVCETSLRVCKYTSMQACMPIWKYLLLSWLETTHV